jgi:hypothetical protein
MQVYKLVYQGFPGLFQSAFAYGRATTFYEVDKPSRAPSWLEQMGYGLCAFETIDDALHFSQGKPLNYAFRLFSADAEEIIDPLPGICSGSDLSDGILAKTLGIWPAGTIMARQLTLREDVTREYQRRATGIDLLAPTVQEGK